MPCATNDATGSAARDDNLAAAQPREPHPRTVTGLGTESHADLDLLAVMAHPDDAELLCGGALAKSAARGGRVGILDLTAGEMGSKGTASTRKQESQRAGQILGVRVRCCAELPDAGLVNNDTSRRTVAFHLRRLRPRIVVTHSTQGRHPDHSVAAELVRDSAYLAGLRMYRTQRVDGGREPPPFRPLKLVYATAFREDAPPPDFVVDITDHVEQRMEAMAAYASQFEDATGMGEVYPGGDRPIFDQVLAKLAHYGSLIRVPYGEPFMANETMKVRDLADLDVSTY